MQVSQAASPCSQLCGSLAMEAGVEVAGLGQVGQEEGVGEAAAAVVSGARTCACWSSNLYHPSTPLSSVALRASISLARSPMSPLHTHTHTHISPPPPPPQQARGGRRMSGILQLTFMSIKLSEANIYCALGVKRPRSVLRKRDIWLPKYHFWQFMSCGHEP